jgi:hypothetical protein
VLESLLLDVGFTDVRVETVSAPLRMPTAAECVRFERESFGALHQMLVGVEPDRREAVWEDIAAKLRDFETGDGFVGPCELLVASATK